MELDTEQTGAIRQSASMLLPCGGCVAAVAVAAVIVVAAGQHMSHGVPWMCCCCVRRWSPAKGGRRVGIGKVPQWLGR